MTYQWSILRSGNKTCNTDQNDRRLTRLPARVRRYFRRPILDDSGFVRSIKPRGTVSLAELNGEMAAEFNLGPKAGALAQQVMNLIAEQPGGVAGFLEKLKEYYGAPAASSIGRADLPLTVRQVKKLAGTHFIKEVAKYLEIPQGFASKVLGAAIPKVAALLADQNATLEELPTYFALAHSRGCAGVQRDASKESVPPLRVERGYGARLRFVIPVVTVFLAGGLLGYAISSATAEHINNAKPAAVACSLPYGIGNGAIAGDFAIGAGWTKNLAAEFHGDGVNPKPPFASKTVTMKQPLSKQAAGYVSGYHAVKRNAKSGHASKS